MERIISTDTFIKDAVSSLVDMVNILEKLPVLSMKEINSNKTMGICIDMNNGFAKKGNLYSPRVEKLIPETEAFFKKCSEVGIKIIAYSDNHSEGCPEMKTYPKHCMNGTEESELIDELTSIKGMITLFKNSTNGFLAANPLNLTYYISKSKLDNLDTFIITGCITEICVYNFATTLKAYFNEQNRDVRVIVPISMVDTYSSQGHNGDLYNVVFFNSMLANGIEVVAGIE